MNSMMSKRPPTVAILARVTEAERDALKEIVWNEGCASLSSWIRMQIVKKLKEASISGSVGNAHVLGQN